jgi:hypothetical protein
VTCGSSRVQLVTDEVVGTPARVRGSAGSPPAGMGKRSTVRVLRQLVTDANGSDAWTVRGWSPGGSDRGTLQVPLATGRSVGGPSPTWSWTRGTPYGGPLPSRTVPRRVSAYGGSVTTIGDWNGSTVSSGTTFSSTTLSGRSSSTDWVSCPSGPVPVIIVPEAETITGNAWPGRTLLGTSPSHRQVMPWLAFLFAGVMLTLGPPTPNWMLTPKIEPLNAVIPPVTTCRRPIVAFGAGLVKNRWIPAMASCSV